jgi:hypothetical protein
MRIAVASFLAVCFACPTLGTASWGRQSDTIEVDYEYRAVSRWLEQNATPVMESTGAQVIKTVGDIVTLRKETKNGVQVFRLKCQAGAGFYRAAFVDRKTGELTDYTYEIKLAPLPNRRTQITITMTATAESAGSVAVNIELRKSLRGLRDFLQQYLVKHTQ